eukprot:scaffold232477_cov33-Tisochrysis_lutea.AAC.1
MEEHSYGRAHHQARQDWPTATIGREPPQAGQAQHNPPFRLTSAHLQVECRLPVRDELVFWTASSARSGGATSQLFLPRRRLSRQQLLQPDGLAPLRVCYQLRREARRRPRVVCGTGCGIGRVALAGEERVSIEATVGEELFPDRHLDLH